MPRLDVRTVGRCTVLCLLGAAPPATAQEASRGGVASRPSVPHSLSFWMEPKSVRPGQSEDRLPWFRMHYRDPGLMRWEYFDGPIPPKQREPARLAHYRIPRVIGDAFHDYTVNLRGERTVVEYCVRYGEKRASEPNRVADWWQRIGEITSDPTNKLGREIVRGVVTRVYEVVGEKLWGPPVRDPSECTSTFRVWVGERTQLPVRTRWQGRYRDGLVVTHTMEDMRWDPEFPEGFFEVPKGCEILRLSDSYTLSPERPLAAGVTFRCHVEDGPVVCTQSELAVSRIEVRPLGYVGRVFFRYASAVEKRWREIHGRFARAPVLWDLNGDIRIRRDGYRSKSRPPNGFDISSLRVSRRQFMRDYLANPTDKPTSVVRPDF